MVYKTAWGSLAFLTFIGLLNSGCQPNGFKAFRVPKNTASGRDLCTLKTPGGCDELWVDDAIPGTWSMVTGSDPFVWVSANPTPDLHNLAMQSEGGSGLHHQSFSTDTNHFFWINSGDSLIAYVYLDPINPPSMIAIEWQDKDWDLAGNVISSWEHRAYWGTNDLNVGVDGTPSRLHQGPLPGLGAWTRLEVKARDLALEEDQVVGMGFFEYGGKATWDRIGLQPEPDNLSPSGPHITTGSAAAPAGSASTVTISVSISNTQNNSNSFTNTLTFYPFLLTSAPVCVNASDPLVLSSVDNGLNSQVAVIAALTGGSLFSDDSVIYNCSFHVNPSAAPGVYRVGCRYTYVQDVQGKDIPGSTCSGGWITLF